MLEYKTKLSDDIAHVFSKELCEEIIRSQNFDDVCEGDCDYCHIKHIMQLIELKRQDLKKNAVLFDNGIRYKFDKQSFDKILESME